MVFTHANSKRTRRVKRKGGLFGFRSLKKFSDNRTNCKRLAENYKPKFDSLYDKHRCAEQYSKDCNHLRTHAGLNFICANDKFIDAYDFNRDGRRVKKRTEPFFDLKTVPEYVNGYPWNDMPHYFDFNEETGEYTLKD